MKVRVRVRVRPAVGLVAAGLAVCAAAALPALAADKALLRYKFKAGETLTYLFVQEDHSAAAIPGAPPAETVSSTTMKMSMAVKRTDKDGAADLENRIYEMTVDAEGAAGSAAKSLASDMKKMWFEVRMLPTGKADKVTVHDVPAGMEPMVDSITTMMRSAVVFPDGPVGPGDSWKDEQKVPLPLGDKGTIDMVLAVTHRLRGFKVLDGRKHAIIEQTVRITTTGRALGGLSISATGDGSGSVTFDVERGVVVSTETSTRIRMTLSAESMSISMDMDSKSKTTLDSVK